MPMLASLGVSRAAIIAGTFNVLADTTAPVLSSASSTVTGQTTATVRVTTDTPEGTLYAVVTASMTTPTAAQIIAGSDNSGNPAVFDDAKMVMATGAQSFSATGLLAGTMYHAFFVHEDAAGNRSAVVGAMFTTQAPPLEATTFDAQSVGPNINLSADKLTITSQDINSAVIKFVRTSTTRTGYRYARFTINQLVSQSDFAFGFVDDDLASNTTVSAANFNGPGVFVFGGFVFYNGVNQGSVFGSALALGDTVDILMRRDDGSAELDGKAEWYIRRNANQWYPGDPATTAGYPLPAGTPQRLFAGISRESGAINELTFDPTGGAGTYPDGAQPWDGAVQSASTINAPVLTQTNAAGDQIDFTIAADESVAVGMYWLMEIAGDAGFTTPPPGKSAILTLDPPEMIQLEHLNSGALSPRMADLLTQMNTGDNYVRVKVGHDPDPDDPANQSDWSNVLTETVTTLADTVFNANDKRNELIIDTTGLVITHENVNVGTIYGARSTLARDGGLWYAEYEASTNSNRVDVAVGMVAGSHNIQSANKPGSAQEPNGFSYNMAAAKAYDSGGPGVTFGSATGATTVIGQQIDLDSNVYWTLRNGVALWGDPVAKTGGRPFTRTGPLFLYAGLDIDLNDSHQLVARLSADQQTYTPPAADAVAWNGATTSAN